jgi:PAS domain S-box-containing protein
VSVAQEIGGDGVASERGASLRWVGWLLGIVALTVVPVFWRRPSHPFQELRSYAALHLGVEVFAVAVSTAVFAVGWNAGTREHGRTHVPLGTGFLAVAVLDLLHALSTAGMPDMVTPSDPEKAIHFWLAARSAAAVAVLLTVLRAQRGSVPVLGAWRWLAGAFAYVALVTWVVLFHPGWLPRTFIAGHGLTGVKIAAEWVLIAISGASALIALRRARLADLPYDAAGLCAAAGVTVFSELCFAVYANTTDVFNFVGHLYKIVAYALIYRAVVVVGVRAPFQRLEESEARFARALRGANDGLFDWDLRTDAIYFSPRWWAILGLADAPKAEHRSTWEALVHPEDREGALAALSACVEEGRDHFDVGMRMRHGDGRWIHIDSHNFLDRDAEGRPLRLTGTVVDVTERIRAEEEIRALNADLERRVADRTADLEVANAALTRAVAAKDEFLAAMSHELRTPLNAVLGLSEAIVEGVYGRLGESQKGALRRVDESGRHLLALIDDILDLSKIGAGKMVLESAPVVVDDVCRASVRLVQEAAARKRQRLSLTLEDSSTVIHTDERRLKQVLLNLLGNAVKFTPEGGSIGVDVAPIAGDRVRFAVWDTGPGIADEDRARLFEPFVQLDARLSRRHGGAGLGLSLVKQLVELSGGTVALESELGKGSRFTVELPAGRPPEPAPESSAAPLEALRVEPTLASGHPRGRVLIADDDEVNMVTEADFLRSRGHEVLLARDGREALEMARREHPDVILMDIQMPGLDGLAATRALRGADVPALREVTILAVTALAMPGDRERCLAAGADDYLAKPIGLRRLALAVEAFLARGNAQPRSSS